MHRSILRGQLFLLRGQLPHELAFRGTERDLRLPRGPEVDFGDDSRDMGDVRDGKACGSVSTNTMLARAKAAKRWNTFTCTGEGGYPDVLIPYKDYVITQIATGLFGVREETIQRTRVIELKYA